MSRIAACAILGLAALLIPFVASAEDSVAFNTGTHKYHRLDCRWAKQCTANCVVIPLAEALARRGIPCKVCAPPTGERQTMGQAPAAGPELSKTSDDRSVGSTKRPGAARGRARGSVIFNGMQMTAWWNDGDSFRPNDGAHDKPVRVLGYNTLETFGPVHRWGDWDPGDLLGLARKATQVAASRERDCSSVGTRDTYGRDMVRCPDVARELVEQGLAMVYAVDEIPDRDLLQAQAVAQARGLGIWARGVPKVILTSVHSADESGDRGFAKHHGKRPYNRIVDTRTGVTSLRPHDRVFQPCADVCETEGETVSCMLYVPFDRRYKNVPDCLR